MSYPYRPSNGSEGTNFMTRFCDRCTKDALYRKTEDGEDGCKILLDTLIYDRADENYPPEWISDDEVGLVEPRCTAFEAEQ